MENQQESVLIKGFYPKMKHENAPDFIIGKGSINLVQFAEFMREFKAANPGEEWVNIDMKVSKAGKGYASVDTWKPDPNMAGQGAPAAAPAAPAPTLEDIPF
jgi:hypothetical protein